MGDYNAQKANRRAQDVLNKENKADIKESCVGKSLHAGANSSSLPSMMNGRKCHMQLSLLLYLCVLLQGTSGTFTEPCR